MDIVFLHLPAVVYKQDFAIIWNMLNLFAFLSISWQASLLKNDLFFHACVYMSGADTCTSNSGEFARVKLVHKEAASLLYLVENLSCSVLAC